ncbi:hypothetical protein EUZ85_27325 [Hahella sp. KA22]|uniref:hypothetical protein n=1 Tax=Hahella sp. KA22 TaxID=1628392 RepID=UPI000FDCEBAC|nr:hypothetical protein [Hahella sp. KA22]AZZ94230.1 hypothetical protein ENC22_24740 [Hahella sp. KA22]QAY57604.1 hypothetical protein EUZ85_27325 [Hahella sp. KA22]
MRFISNFISEEIKIIEGFDDGYILVIEDVGERIGKVVMAIIRLTGMSTVEVKSLLKEEPVVVSKGGKRQLILDSIMLESAGAEVAIRLYAGVNGS